MSDSILNDNVRLDLGTGGALVATDYLNVDGITSHVQYIKIGYGASGEFVQVDSDVSPNISGPLPVALFTTTGGDINGDDGNSINVQLSASGITLPILIADQTLPAVAVAGNTSGTYPVVVAGNTSGGPVSVALTGGTSTVEVVGLAGAYPVGITGTDFDIRGLTATFDITNYAGGSYGVSGDIVGAILVRGLSAGASNGVAIDSVSVQGLPNARPVSASIDPLGHGLSAGFTGSYTSVYDLTGVQGVSGGLPVPAVLAFSSETALPAGHTAIGFSGDALLVSLQESGISATVNIPSIITIEGFTGGAGLSGIPSLLYGLSGSSWEEVGMSGDALRVSLAEDISVSVGTVSVSNNTLTVTGTGGIGQEVIVGGTSGRWPITIIGASGMAGGTAEIAKETTVSGIATDVDSISTDISSQTTFLSTASAKLTSIESAIGDTSDADYNGIWQAITNTYGNTGAFNVIVTGSTAPTAFVAGSTTVPTSALNLQSQTVTGIRVKAHPNNATLVYIGNTSENLTSHNGFPLSASEDAFLEIDNASKIYFVATETGNTLSWMGS